MKRLTFFLFIAFASIMFGFSSNAQTNTVKVAAVHFAPVLGDVARNRQTLINLTKEAASNGAKIIVHTEMATSGYAFFSRAEIMQVAETIPGPTTIAVGSIAKEYQIYVVVGMPIRDERTNLFYNAAVLIGPGGEVLGTYKKRSNLLEASYNANVFDDVPVFKTEYGTIGIVICADLFYSEFPRIAAIHGATILLAPANVGITTDFIAVRAIENDMAIVVANRYGSENAGSKPPAFSEDTFAIKSPFAYDFSWDSRSAILSRYGTTLAEHSAHQDSVIYGDIDIRDSNSFPVLRRPEMYSLLAQDTLDEYTETQLGQPASTNVAVAAVDPDSLGGALTESSLTNAIETAVANASAIGAQLRLVVLPQNEFSTLADPLLVTLKGLATKHQIDIVAALRGDDVSPLRPASILITPEGTEVAAFSYQRAHKLAGENIDTSDDFLVIDRSYARIAILQDEDLLVPETSAVMARMGVDIVAVSADFTSPVASALWQSRTADYLHLIVANHAGLEGIYAGGYKSTTPVIEADGIINGTLNTADVRDRKRARFFDPTPLVLNCAESKC